jgi:hypothetical protein
MKYLPPSRRQARRGAVAAWVAICLSLLLGVAALAVDAGFLMVERRHAQAAADAAALAAAVDVVNDSSPWNTTYTTARNVATANYTNTAHLTVTPSVPPSAGTFKNVTTDSNGYTYVEVKVEWDQPRYFSAIFGSGNVPVKARSVARAKYGVQSANLIVLNRGNTSGALTISGGATLNIPGAIAVNSTDPTAATLNGSGTQVVASAIQVSGGFSPSSMSGWWSPTQGSTANDLTSAPQVADPLITLPVPDTSTLTPRTYTQQSGTQTIQPGIYAGGITVPNGSTVTLSPGIYYLEGGGLTVKNGGTLKGNGVMIYNGETGGATTNPSSVGAINISGSSAVVQLTPMTTGTYANISIFQDRNATTGLILKGGSGGAGNTNISGAIYAAKAAATITGNSNIVPGAAFVTDTLTIQGGSGFTLPNSPITIPDPTKRVISLVE